MKKKCSLILYGSGHWIPPQVITRIHLNEVGYLGYQANLEQNHVTPLFLNQSRYCDTLIMSLWWGLGNQTIALRAHQVTHWPSQCRASGCRIRKKLCSRWAQNRRRAPQMQPHAPSVLCSMSWRKPTLWTQAYMPIPVNALDPSRKPKQAMNLPNFVHWFGSPPYTLRSVISLLNPNRLNARHDSPHWDCQAVL